ncbi:MAG: HupE/UreJ family protein [Phormidesmis sp. RL_2_1]|nr:HupE/UreJ family protein [Phormidesmis sp. RL_2_1]
MNIRLNSTGLAHHFVTRFAAISAALAMLLAAAPAMAHHPFGRQAPQTIFEGFVSGIGHPVLGLDHLAFVIAVGLLAAVLRRGVLLPIVFLLAALVGTSLHLAGLNLPAPEFVIAGSVVLFGGLAASEQSLKSLNSPLSMLWVITLTSFAGLFHGYAYGESIIGAEPTPLVAYLVGFTLVQGAIASAAYQLAHQALSPRHHTDQKGTAQRLDNSAGPVSVRYAGFAILGAGIACLGQLLV